MYQPRVDGSVPSCLTQRELKVADLMRERCATHTVRQLASIFEMSMPFMKCFAEKHKIDIYQFNGVIHRDSTESVKREKSHVRAVNERSIIISNRKPRSVDPSLITMGLQAETIRCEQRAKNSFVERVRKLSMTMTRSESLKDLDVSPDFMRTFAYDHGIYFVGERAPMDSVSIEKHVAKSKKGAFKQACSSAKPVASFLTSFALKKSHDTY